MMKPPDHILENDRLRVMISSHGGELQSVVGVHGEAAGIEYLWQGDVAYWRDKAINLFPYIGRLTGGVYRYQGNVYEMDMHGFLKDSDMELFAGASDTVSYRLRSNSITEQQYPFSFCFEIRYVLRSNRLDIEFAVHNDGDEVMYFGLGGHPGFRVPLTEGESFEDYYLVFPDAKDTAQIILSEDCFTTGDVITFPLCDGRYLDLRHDLFDNDAIVLYNTGGRVSLKSRKSGNGVDVIYPDMQYLGLWHTPRTSAPFLCIEPWTSLPSRDGVTEDISTQENLIALKANGEYLNRWSIVFN